MSTYDVALGDHGKEKFPFHRKKLLENKSQGGAGICCSCFRINSEEDLNTHKCCFLLKE